MQPKLRVLVTEKMIKKRVGELADLICSDYADSPELDIICVLKGAFIFTSDLVREIGKKESLKLRIHMLKAKSYSGTESTGKVCIDCDADVRGRDIILVEDIVDTGLTLHKVSQMLKHSGAKSVRICSLLSKPSRRKNDIAIHYLGFEIDDLFVVGYGLDHDERYREMPDICYFEDL